MHLEKDILKGKFGKNKKLHEEAEEELEESPKGKKILKKLDPKKEALEKKKKGAKE